MNKLFCGVLCASMLFGQSQYYGSSTAAVVIAGAVIKTIHNEVVKKYKRKDCPVCKGKGWYMSGDNIKKIDCQYCEDTGKEISKPIFIQK